MCHASAFEKLAHARQSPNQSKSLKSQSSRKRMRNLSRDLHFPQRPCASAQCICSRVLCQLPPPPTSKQFSISGERGTSRQRREQKVAICAITERSFFRSNARDLLEGQDMLDKRWDLERWELNMMPNRNSGAGLLEDALPFFTRACIPHLPGSPKRGVSVMTKQ